MDRQFTARKFRDLVHCLNIILEYAGIRCPDDKTFIQTSYRLFNYKSGQDKQNNRNDTKHNLLRGKEFYCLKD